MTRPSDRLYQLLPAVYRIRDQALVGDAGSPPLRELLRVIGEQVDQIDADVTQLYENWFIETCEPWVIPYLGDLIGYRPVYDYASTFAGMTATARAAARESAIVPRREVAKTIAFRRRKGTAALLPELALAVAGWPSVSVETYQRLGVTQSLRHLRLDRGTTRALHPGVQLDRVDAAFDDSSYTVDVRRASSVAMRGQHNIPEVALFAWRLRSASITETAACCVEDVGPNCFTFNVMGHDTQLFVRPEPPGPHTDPALTVPAPITRRAWLDELSRHGRVVRYQASAAYYGEHKSIAIWAADWPKRGNVGIVARSAIIPSDLSTWSPAPPRNHVAVDPVLGRILFPANQFPKSGVRVSYGAGFSANMGSGEYPRPISQPSSSTVLRVGAHEQLKTLREAIDKWQSIKQAAREPSAGEPQPLVLSVVIEIADNGVYTERLDLTLEAGESLQLRSADGARAVIRLLDYMADRPDAFSLRATGDGARVVLDGLLIAGRGLQVYGRNLDCEDPSADLCEVVIRDCTLVPGWLLECDCEPKRPNEPSVELISATTTLRIERSIVGTIVVASDEVRDEPARIAIEDSIVDATGRERCAIAAASGPAAYAVLTLARCTIFGRTESHAIELAENTIFMGEVFVARKQLGCLRFCYVPPGARTPRRFHCQPDTAVANALEGVDDSERDSVTQAAQSRVEPVWNSTRFGSPHYAQLSELCDEAIAQGADDGSEMGVFHDLYQPQRLANLTTRLAEYSPAGMDIGVFFAS